MCHYKHLSPEEREKARVFSAQGLNFTEIAKKLNRSKSTISREFKRNSNSNKKREYSAHEAQKKYTQRKKNCGAKPKLQDKNIRKYAEEKLALFWSPEQIAGRAKLEKQSFSLSHNTIYRAINSGALPKDMKKKLRRKGKNKRYKTVDNRGKILNRIPLSERPKSADNRTRFGHWESDTVLGTRGTGCIGTHVERKSGFLIAIRLPDRESNAFAEKTIAAFASVPASLKKSFTADNGKEFASHALISKGTGMPVYFCDPYCPGQRGTNENTNGLLRQFFPKKTSFTCASGENLHHAVDLINHRPRKRLKFKTPHEILQKLLHLI